MRDARIHELIAHRLEAVMNVKRQGMQLRVKDHAAQAQATRDIHERP